MIGQEVKEKLTIQLYNELKWGIGLQRIAALTMVTAHFFFSLHSFLVALFQYGEPTHYPDYGGKLLTGFCNAFLFIYQAIFIAGVFMLIVSIYKVNNVVSNKNKLIIIAGIAILSLIITSIIGQSIFYSLVADNDPLTFQEYLVYSCNFTIARIVIDAILFIIIGILLMIYFANLKITTERSTTMLFAPIIQIALAVIWSVLFILLFTSGPDNYYIQKSFSAFSFLFSISAIAIYVEFLVKLGKINLELQNNILDEN